MEAILDKVLALLGSAEGMSVTVAVVMEFVLRLIPSKKPLGLLHIAGDLIEKAGYVLVKVGQLLDKILPQKVIEPPVG